MDAKELKIYGTLRVFKDGLIDEEQAVREIIEKSQLPEQKVGEGESTNRYLGFISDLIIQFKRSWNDGFSQGQINDGYEGTFEEWYEKNEAQIRGIIPFLSSGEKEAQWISVDYLMPGYDKNGEPRECSLQNDFNEEILKGYFDENKWWIEKGGMTVGHYPIDSFDIDFKITHWMPPPPLDQNDKAEK